ncbi:MAG: hypothetical protein ACI4MP_07250 [Candidatus Ventricola sp.]
MKSFYIIARVHGTQYITKVSAETALMAEHMILDEGICGKHEYGCDACMAYDVNAMKTDAFIGAALHAEPVSLCELMEKIEKNNARIKAKDDAENAYILKQKMVEEIRRQMEIAEKELIEAKKAFEAA